MIDLDALSYACPGPVEDRFNSELVLRNLKAVWPNYAARGVDHLVLARYVGTPTELDAYRRAVPSATLTVCRVTAPAETVRERLLRREAGLERDFLLALSETLAARTGVSAVEDFVVANGPGAAITDLAREVVRRLGWPVDAATAEVEVQGSEDSHDGRMHWLLTYDYVAGIATRRAPFREAHLRLVRDLHTRGALLMAGAVGDPIAGALLVFTSEDQEVVEEFVAQDPYVEEGLVTAWQIRPWNVVVGQST